MEMGPANNPQTNGLAERFTILLSKMRLSLVQPRVLISLCNEAALYSSMLINILTSKALAWHTPMDILNQQKIYIEPTRNINRLVPFGLQCHVHSKNTSKLHPTTKPLLCLGYETFTDGLRFYHQIKHSIVISRDYTLSPCTLKYNDPRSLTKPVMTLPYIIETFKDNDNNIQRIQNTSTYLDFPSKKPYESNNNNNNSTTITQVHNPPVDVLETPPLSPRSNNTTSEDSPPPIPRHNFRNAPIHTTFLHPPPQVPKAPKEISSRIQVKDILTTKIRQDPVQDKTMTHIPSTSTSTAVVPQLNIKAKKKAPKEINSNIDKSKIITVSRRRKPVIPAPPQD